MLSLAMALLLSSGAGCYCAYMPRWTRCVQLEGRHVRYVDLDMRTTPDRVVRIAVVSDLQTSNEINRAIRGSATGHLTTDPSHETPLLQESSRSCQQVSRSSTSHDPQSALGSLPDGLRLRIADRQVLVSPFFVFRMYRQGTMQHARLAELNTKGANWQSPTSRSSPASFKSD